MSGRFGFGIRQLAERYLARAPQDGTRPAYLHAVFYYPTSNYASDDKIPILVLPLEAMECEIDLVPRQRGFPKRFRENKTIIPAGLSPGHYVAKIRCRPCGGKVWSHWTTLRFQVHDTGKDIRSFQAHDHRIEAAIERGIGGTVTVMEPDALPPYAAALNERRWFATPVYEGATPLLNEEEDYYRDPLRYYLAAIDRMIDKSARFVTWHDMLDGTRGSDPLEVIVQFDIDGGPHSMQRLCAELIERGVRANIMTHRRGHYWYPYDIEDFGLDWLRDAEKAGWTIGYHNNALSQCAGQDSDDIYTDECLARADEIFRDDVEFLRQHFNIRTYTHHGGNIYNHRMSPLIDDVVCVDKPKSPALWQDIRSSFSDGGFLVRPYTLRRKVEDLAKGLHFFRNHPFKYGNFDTPMDVPPRSAAEAERAGVPVDAALQDWQARELKKEAEWIAHRQTVRSTVRLAHSRLDKPISSAFAPFPDVADRVRILRDSRRSEFIRLYPWENADPRVFWCRMLEAWGPKTGDVLNVGALPPAEKEQNALFLSDAVRIVDCDIDEAREPTYCIDVADAPQSLNESFSATLLFGLPYFDRPSRAVEACARLTRRGGRGLFGFAASTSPARGSVWNPEKRHLWRREKEPLQNIGLHDNLWAFDDEGLADLFASWDSFRAEFMGHYWFVVAKKHD